MKKLLLFLALILSLTQVLQAQTAISLTGTPPDASAMFDVSATNKGMLIPRVALTSTGATAPVASPLTSLLVYNTAGVGDVTPGYYYWNGTAWTRLLNGATNLSGAGTTDYLARWTPNGNVLGIGVTRDNGTNVGIGGAPGTVRLKLTGDIESDSQIRATGWLAGTGTGAGAELGVASGYAYLHGYNRSTSAYIPARVVGTTIDLRHSDASSDLFVATSGFVGINHAAPARNLDINGTTRMRDWLSFGSSDDIGRITWGGDRFYMNGFAGKKLSLGSNAVVDHLLIDLNGNVGINQTSPTVKLQVGGEIMRTNTRVDNAERYPVAHPSAGSDLLGIDPTWTNAELQAYFNTANVQWSADATAPAGWAIQITGAVNVGGEYGSGFAYIPVETGATYYMECWIRSTSGADRHYMGSNEYNQSFTSLGGNPGSYGYWVMSNTLTSTTWTKYSAVITGFDANAVGKFELGTKYWTPMALFNYGTGGTSFISGWKVTKILPTTTIPSVVTDYIQNQNSSAQASANYWISGNGKANLFELNNGFQLSQGGSNYGAFNSWFQSTGNHGIYWPSASGYGSAPHLWAGGMGDYGSLRIEGVRSGWSGLSLEGRFVLMTNGASGTTVGLYNDIDNEWMIEAAQNGALYNYHDGTWRTQTTSGGMMVNGNLQRNAHHTGHLEGSYNNVGANSAKSNPIYTIGSAYNPVDAGLSNMYGIGYSHSNFWGTANNRPGGWGQYVAAAGVARIILEASTGRIWAESDVRAPLFYDTDNTSFYVDPASSSVLRGTVTIHDDGAPSPLLDIRADDTSPWAIRLYNDSWGTGPQIYASATDQIYTSGYWRGGTGLCIGGDCRTAWPSGADNLGNHTATTTLNMNSQAITNIVDAYNSGWFRNNNTNQGLYNQATGRHLYSESGSYWTCASGAGMIFRNSHAGAITGYSYSDGGSSFGTLSPNGNWRFRCDNSNSEAYGSGFYAPTSYIGFIYDRDNTGYYWNGDGTSRMYYGDFNYLHTQVNDSWFPYTGNNWNYFRGNSYITNAHWYDENNSGYYFNLDNTNRLAYLYYGIGAWNTTGWLNGVMTTPSADDGHQYNSTNAWGYVGTSGQAWWRMYSYGYINASQREIKRNIHEVKADLSDYVMNDIDKMNTYMYKYNVETDEMQEGNEPKFRPQMHIGLIVDDTPDYLLDGSFNGVDIYAVASLAVAGVKHNRKDIKEIEQRVQSLERASISDFGTDKLDGETAWIPYSPEFATQLTGGVIPVITVTATELGADIVVVEKNSEGFKVKKSGTGSLNFDWIAMAKVVVNTKDTEATPKLSQELIKNLVIDESVKAQSRQYWADQNAKNEAQKQKLLTEHEETVKKGESNYMETLNPVDENIAKRAEEAKRNYIAVPEDAPAKAGNLGDPNPSKEGAPK